MKAPNSFVQIILLLLTFIINLMFMRNFSLSYIDLFKTNFLEVKICFK